MTMLNEDLAKKIKLSPNFTLWEFLRSDDAVKYCLMALQFVIDFVAFHNMQLLCIKVLEPLRTFLNDVVTVSSGFRSATLNNTIKGSQNSHHKRAMAADIVVKDMQKAFDYLRTLQFTQLIWEEAIINGVLVKWIHVSYDPKDLRCEVLKFENGSYTKL